MASKNSALGMQASRRGRGRPRLGFGKPPISLITLSIIHSLSPDRAGQVQTNGSTLSGNVYIRLANNEPRIVRTRWFVGPVGSFVDLDTLPDFPDSSPASVTAESDHIAFVRGDSVWPYDLKGGPIPPGAANAWNTSLDPKSGSDRSHFHSDGQSDILAQALLNDGTIVSEIATITRSNGPTSPVLPNTPISLSGTVSDNQVTVTWANGGTSGAADATVSYEIAYSSTDSNPAIYTPVVPNAASYIIIGAPGIWYYRVRAVDADGDRSAPTAVQSREIVGGGTILPGLRIEPSYDMAMYPFRKGGNHGSGSHSNPDNYIDIGRAWTEANIDKDSPNNNSLPNQCVDALNDWNNRASARGSRYINAPNIFKGSADGGPRGMINLPVGYGPTRNARPGAGNLTSSSTNNVKSIIQMANVVLGTWDNHYTALANGFVARNNSNYGGYNDWEKRIIVRLGHENNGPWYPWYSGIDSNIAAKTTSQKNALFASIQSLPEDILADIYAGDRGSLYREAFRHIVDRMRSVLPGFIFDWNVSHPGADPDGSEDPLDLTRSFNPKAWVGADYADIMSLDIYARSSAGNLSQGFSDNAVQFLKDFKDLRDARQLADGREIAIGFGEVGIPIRYLTRTNTITAQSFNPINNTMTFTTATPHGYVQFSPVDVSNVANGNSSPGVGKRAIVYNGRWRITAVTSNTFTVSDPPPAYKASDPNTYPRDAHSGSDAGNVAQVVDGSSLEDHLGSKRAWTIWMEFLLNNEVTSESSGLQLFPAGYLGPIAYWMQWNSMGVGHGTVGNHYPIFKDDNPQTWNVVKSYFGP